jgi:hypothetical protein
MGEKARVRFSARERAELWEAKFSLAFMAMSSS